MAPGSAHATRAAGRRAGRPEVPDVDALGAPDADARLQRLVHVAEQHQPRLGLADRLQHRRAAPLEPPRRDVVEQLGHVRRDVAGQHVDRADRGDLGGVVLVVDLVRRAHRRLQPAADEAPRPAADLDRPRRRARCAPRAGSRATGAARRRCRRSGRSGRACAANSSAYCAATASSMTCARVPVERRPTARARTSRASSKRLRGAQRDQALGGSRAPNSVGEDAAGRVVVVEEQHQVAEADQASAPSPARASASTLPWTSLTTWTRTASRRPARRAGSLEQQPSSGHDRQRHDRRRPRPRRSAAPG